MDLERRNSYLHRESFSKIQAFQIDLFFTRFTWHKLTKKALGLSHDALFGSPHWILEPWGDRQKWCRCCLQEQPLITWSKKILWYAILTLIDWFSDWLKKKESFIHSIIDSFIQFMTYYDRVWNENSCTINWSKSFILRKKYNYPKTFLFSFCQIRKWDVVHLYPKIAGTHVLKGAPILITEYWLEWNV